MSWFSWSPSTPAPGATRTTAREVEDCEYPADVVAEARALAGAS